MRILFCGVVVMALAVGMVGCSGSSGSTDASAAQTEKAAQTAKSEPAPTFELDPSWPKQPLPNGYEFGYVMAVGLDQRDHAFVLHTVQEEYDIPGLVNESLQISKWFERKKKPGVVAAPTVVEFDPNGNFVRGWGGNGHGYPWLVPGPEQVIAEHELDVDPKGNVWVAGGGHVALKFSPEGKFLLQIGKLWQTHGSADPDYLGDPSALAFDAKANEVYIADGLYRNKRIIVFDMDTGAFKRMWAKGGKKPVDDFEEPQTGMSVGWVHDVDVSNDGLVYGLGGRPTHLIQVYRTDGTFVREVPLKGKFSSLFLSTDPQQYYLYAAEMEEPNPYPSIFIYRRSDLTLLGSFKTPSGIPRASHHFPGVDSKGNIYTTGNLMPERFLLKTMPKATN